MIEYVWLKPKKGTLQFPIGARILGIFDSRIKVEDDDNKEYFISSEEIVKPMHPSSIAGVDDMTTLSELQEYSILRNLLIRYKKDYIYTYIGSVLVAVNPYKDLPIYSSQEMMKYRRKRLEELPPHIFAIADNTYEIMRVNSEKLCIIISGESGTGKTVSTRLLLQYYAQMINRQKSDKKNQILNSNLVLEAFGNAKTVSNDNSSRFGKYVVVNFSKDGNIESAEIKHYLLEKSRIICQNEGEQNYHIFYSILKGMPELEKQHLHLTTSSSYYYLNTAESASISFYKEYNKIRAAFLVLNFTDDDIWNVFKTLAVILHLGNILYEGVSQSNIESVVIGREHEIQVISELLQVDKEQLIHCLTKKTIAIHSDQIITPLSKKQAIDYRDAFSKRIYENLFNFVVEKINAVLVDEEKKDAGYIGLLDIFGFETLERNSFEQLCINYANERLHKFFIKHMFKIEQKIYVEEGINWKYLSYPDNDEILELIEFGPKSILSTINDESKFPQSTDQSLLSKLIGFHSENNNFFKPKFNFAAVFGIQHFAGVVLYDVKHFLEKNHDSFNYDIKQVVESSGNPFLQKIFAGDLETDYSGVYKNKKDSLIDRFKSSLNSLIFELNQCQSHFIRCIRPNEYKKPQIFNRTLCWKQLRYSGMLETTKIRESGYPVRYNYIQFVQKFWILHPDKPSAYKINCKNATLKICNLALNMQQKSNVQLGRTQVFLKHSEELILEKKRNDALQRHVRIIQKIVRGWIARQRYCKLKKAVKLLESSWLKKKKHRESIKLISNSEEPKRSDSKSRSSLKIMLDKNFITRFQAHCRGYLVRQNVRNSDKKLIRRNSMNSSPTFARYANKYFQKKQNYEFSKKPLKTPLHDNMRSMDAVGAKVLWSTILRYTENISEPKKIVPSVLPLLRDILWRIHIFEKTSKESIAEIDGLYKKWLTIQSNKYQKLEFIIGHGIARPVLRDEIYCQICKVITKNPSEIAKTHAWNLLSSCCSSFPPSSSFLNYLKAFVKEEKNKFTSYCLYRLRKVLEKGCRNQSPWFTELEAIKQLKPVEVAVILMNGKTINVKIDSLTTVKEMLEIVAKNIYLRDSFGFSLLLEQDKKLFSMGSSSNYVFDAIAQREKYAWEISNSFDTYPWRIFLKKEFFAPWHYFSDDGVSTDLICNQIKNGLRSGEYECEVEDIHRVLAKICFCVYGKIQQSVFHEIVDNCIPRHICILLDDEGMLSFKNEVETFYFKVESHKPTDIVRAELIQFAMKKWPLHFSKLFSVTGTVTTTSSRICSESLLNIFLNSYGLQFTSENDAKNKPILKMDFAEIKDITRKKLDQGYFLKITSFLGVEVTLIFSTHRDTDLYELLIEIMNTLREYSKYVIARNANLCQENSFMQIKEGDLIILTSKFCGRDLISNSWAEGQNVRTKETGKFLINNVEIIPSIESPKQSLLQVLTEAKANVTMKETAKKPERLKHHTLEIYADKFFTRKKDKSIKLWKHSREKLEHPLHFNLTKHIYFVESIQVFEAILMYMGDISKKELKDSDVIQKIFNSGLKHDELRDEIYCQIMKQLTNNENRESNDRGWELMWIVTGLFACSKNLTKEVQKFLMTRRVRRMPRICLSRFYKAINSGTRKFICHPLEIKAMHQEPCEILYRIYFPDYSHKFFQINSLMTIEQLKNIISKRLGILQNNGFELFAQVKERVFLIPSDYFIFDFFKHFDDWIFQSNINNSKAQYFLFFMLHSWKNIVPGRNETIDTKFLFPQEYNKYIKGCHKVPDKDIINLAVFLYNIFSSKKENQHCLQILHKLLPENIINRRKQKAWEKDIQLNLCRKQILSETVSKIKFLQYLFKLPSYGLTYFSVKCIKNTSPNHILYPLNLTTKSGF